MCNNCDEGGIIYEDLYNCDNGSKLLYRVHFKFPQVCTRTCIQECLFQSFLLMAKAWKKHRCPSTEEQVNFDLFI